MCVVWILYFQLKKKIATQGLEPVAGTSAALELDEEEDEEENSGTATPTPTSTTRGPSIPPPSPLPPTSRRRLRLMGLIWQRSCPEEQKVCVC